jgi:uncharacterized alkaline shock family protein YloU
VRILVENNTVYTDLYVVLNGGENVRNVCRTIQQRVARAVSEMVGMKLGNQYSRRRHGLPIGDGS